MKKFRTSLIFLTALLLIATISCAAGEKDDSTRPKSEVKMKIASTAFSEGDTIPVQYTCDSADISPSLLFYDIPPAAQSLALICDDPDAPMGVWVHWVLLGIPPNAKGLPEKIVGAVTTIVKIEGRDVALMHGKNDFGTFAYGGPCPPKGKPHRYYFKLYALDTVLKPDKETIAGGITKQVLLDLMKGHILAEASLMGKYQRK